MTSGDDHDLEGFAGIGRLFPLPGVVHFPHTVLPLHIFEPRYRQLTEHALSSDGLVTIVQTRADRTWPREGEPELETVACRGGIIAHERLPDGRFNLLLHGCQRVRILNERNGPTLYRQAEVEVLDEVDAVADPAAVRSALLDLYRPLATHGGGLDQDLERFLASDMPLGVLTDFLAFTLVLPATAKQALLEECLVDRRVHALQRLLRAYSGPAAESGWKRDYPPRFSEN